MCVREGVVLLDMCYSAHRQQKTYPLYRDREGGWAWGALATPLLSGKK